MRKLSFRKVTVKWLLTGGGIGLLMAILGFYSGMWGNFFKDSYPIDMTIVGWLLVGAYYPARCFIHLWVYMNLPPTSELAWVILPPIAIMLQWTLLGLLVGLWRCSTTRKGANNLQ